MTRDELTDSIKQKALEIGFSKAGVTSAEPFDEAAARFESWVKAGSHGLMAWLEKDLDRGVEKRRDVSTILPGARSILSLALNYYHSEEIAEDSDHKISRYAWGTDYHEVVPGMLERLLNEIKLITASEGLPE